MTMTPERWEFLNVYARDLFGDTSDQLATLMDRAAEAGLPPIAVSPDVGRLLQILASLTPGRLAIELGTLGGYSGIWIARGLSPEGKLITIEYDETHADFAEAEFASAGLSGQVQVVRGAALDVLPEIAGRVGPESVDFAFLDAVKTEYPDYFRALKPLMAPGGVLVADNVYGTGQGWIDEGYGTDPFNRAVAGDPEFISTIVPMREGILIARRRA
jgi:predicted O-methyltransferase YrrM